MSGTGLGGRAELAPTPRAGLPGALVGPTPAPRGVQRGCRVPGGSGRGVEAGEGASGQNWDPAWAAAGGWGQCSGSRQELQGPRNPLSAGRGAPWLLLPRLELPRCEGVYRFHSCRENQVPGLMGLMSEATKIPSGRREKVGGRRGDRGGRGEKGRRWEGGGWRGEICDGGEGR